MRVVFLEDVAGVAQGGDVKEVKNGFARNYLIPKNLAVAATHNALQGVKRLADEAEKTRIRELSDLRELAGHLEGVQVNIEMRAGVNGQLYGSVTNAMVADKLFEATEREIDRRVIQIDEPIRQLGNFEVVARLHSEVQSRINVLVYPSGTDPEVYAQSLLAQEAAAESDAESEGDAESAETLEGEITDEQDSSVEEAEEEAEAESEEPEEVEAEAEPESEEPEAEEEAEAEEDEDKE